MRIFDVGNSNKTGAFIMAIDEADAVKIAIQIGHMKKPNRRPIVDLTARMVDEPCINDLMQRGFRGRLMKELPSCTFEDVIKRIQTPPAERPKGRWLPMIAVEE